MILLRNMKQKILVVDDEPDAVELLEVNLKRAGYEVVSAHDGEEALTKARMTLPDLIILDLMLPEVDGMEVCKILRRDQKTAGIPIIMLTAKAAEIDRVLGLREIVVRPLTDRLVQVPGIAGATELGDGRVVLILDTASLSRGVRKRGAARTVSRAATAELSSLPEKTHVI